MMASDGPTGTFLKDLLIATLDGDWGKDEPKEGHVPHRVIRGADFPDARVGLISGIPRCYLAAKTVGRRTLEPNDIIIETAGGNRDRPTGRTLLVTQRLLKSLDLPATCASFCRFLRVDPEKAVPGYVFWYLQYLYHLGEMWKHQVQHTGVARFQYTKFAESERIPLPPKRVQAAIADTLSALDEKIDLNQQMNGTLEAMARAVFRSWFVDFDPVRAKIDGRKPEGMDSATAKLFPDKFEESALGPVPKAWRVAQIKTLTSNIQYGLTQSASETPVGPHFLRITDIQGGRVDWSKVPYCVVDSEDADKYRIRSGDIFVARTGASTGENIYVDQSPDAVFASYLVRFQFADDALGRVVGQFMRTPEYFDYVAGVIGGSAQPNASAQVLAGATLVVPPLEIARRFKELVEHWDKMRYQNDCESCTLTEIRDALLPKLLSGEVTPH